MSESNKNSLSLKNKEKKRNFKLRRLFKKRGDNTIKCFAVLNIFTYIKNYTDSYLSLRNNYANHTHPTYFDRKYIVLLSI